MQGQGPFTYMYAIYYNTIALLILWTFRLDKQTCSAHKYGI